MPDPIEGRDAGTPDVLEPSNATSCADDCTLEGERRCKVDAPGAFAHRRHSTRAPAHAEA